MKNKTSRNTIFLILFLSLFLRLSLSLFGTLQLDHNTFVAWSNSLALKGFSTFYRGWSDYLPGYLYILWFLGKVHTIFPGLPTEVLYKLPAIFSDIITGFLIFRVVTKLKGRKWGLISSVIYLFNPAIITNSSLWGQVDSLTALFSLLSVNFSLTNPILAGIFFSLGILVKPQAALAGFVIFYIALKKKWKIVDYFKAFIFFLLPFVLLFLPFAGENNLFVFIYQRILLTFNQYPYTSVNAFSFWGLSGFWKTDTLITSYIGYFLILIVFAILAIKLWKKEGGHWLLLSMVFLSGFLFQTRMHERHLLPALAPLAISLTFNFDLLIPYLVLSFTYIANLYYSYIWITNNFKNVFSSDLIKLFIVLNLLALVFLMKHILNKKDSKILILVKRLLASKKLILGSREEENYKFPEQKLSKKKLKLLLWVVIIFATVTRFAWLWQPKNMYFDEVYHAFTGKLVLHADPKAWEWWNPHPEGFAYEWTHPPLAKLGMALGMKIFGENAFGWRFPGALLGVGCVFLVYLIAKNIFHDELLGILSAAVFSLDGLVLVMNRIGMNETYILFFMLLAVYLFWQKKDFLSAIAFGLAVSSKWSAIWAIPIFGVIWLGRRKKFTPGLFSFLLVPFIYIGSYFQMFLTGHGLNIFWGMQKQMWWYHTNLKATHAYTSSWWTWPLDLRPVYLYTSDEVSGWVARIYNIGNPAVFWFGLGCVFFFFGVIIANKLKISFFNLPFIRSLILVLFSYIIFFVPWAASPRIMFFYHYLPSLPFLAIIIGYFLRNNLKFIPVFFIFAGVLFLYFFPHWAGLSVPIWLDKSYYWFSSWR